MDRWMVWIDGWMDGWCGWMDGWMDGWCGWMDGVDRWMVWMVFDVMGGWCRNEMV